jgi:CHASE3 domain sensor protein
LLTDVNTPANEYQIRPLVKLSPDQQREAWQQAVATAPDGKVTAAHVAKIVKEMTAETPAKDGFFIVK